MHVAIVHHHLRPGGVTRVIENATASLQRAGHTCVVITGEPCPEQSPLHEISRIAAGLGYVDDAAFSAEVLAARIRSAAGAPKPDLWHFHNHSLGKNIRLPDAVEIIAAEEPVLLQIHDFAEDGRPSNYTIASQAATLYPQGPRCHYAVLTQRDQSVLSNAGLTPGRLHLLPNPVSVPKIEAEPIQRERPLLFYPTRGIRRKNVGEVVLLATLLSDEGIEVATSRAPDNPQWMDIHRRWETFVRERRIPVRLGVVGDHTHGGHGFDAWVATANAMLTTSITEGFGLAFLEPILFGKPLVGRDLPDITADFKTRGLTFPGLYRSLLVPSKWIDLQELHEQFAEKISEQFRTYRRVPPKDAASRAIAAISHSDKWIDFGGLDESHQESVIGRCLEDCEERKQIQVLGADGNIHPVAPWVHAKMRIAPSETDARILKETYSLEAYAQTLIQLYSVVIDGVQGQASSFTPEKVLDQFLSPEHFHCLKTG